MRGWRRYRKKRGCGRVLGMARQLFLGICLGGDIGPVAEWGAMPTEGGARVPFHSPGAGARASPPIPKPPCTPHPAPCTQHPAPCTQHPAPCTRHPARRTQHRSPQHRSPPRTPPRHARICAHAHMLTQIPSRSRADALTHSRTHARRRTADAGDPWRNGHRKIESPDCPPRLRFRAQETSLWDRDHAACSMLDARCSTLDARRAPLVA